MKPPTPERTPLSPVTQLRNVIDAVFDELPEEEARAGEQELQPQIDASAARVELMKFAQRYAATFDIEAEPSPVEPQHSEKPEIEGAEVTTEALKSKPRS